MGKIRIPVEWGTPLRPSQERWVMVRLWVVLCIPLVVALMCSTPAKADPPISPYVVDYARTHAGVVCTVLADHPTLAGVEGVLLGVMDDGLSPYEAGQVVGLAVYGGVCPEFTGLLDRFVVANDGARVGIA